MHILMLVLAIAAGAVAAQVPGETIDGAIDAAIADGRARNLTGSVEVGSDAAGRFSIRLAGPLGRVALAAAFAQRDGEPFGRNDVTPEMTGPAIQVLAYPNDPDFGVTRRVVTPPAERIELQVQTSRTRRTVIEPVRSEAFTLRWSSGIGVVVEGRGLRADFERDALPDREFDVVVHTERGQQRYRVRPRDLETVR
jgi:RNase P/RNase MRP subunit p29